MLLNDRYSHLLFDYDGLLVNSEKLYYQAWCHFLNDDGKEICKGCYEGNHESDTYKIVQQYLLEPISLDELSTRKKKIYDELVESGQLELMPGIKDVLSKLNNSIPMSVVSNSNRNVVSMGLKSTRLDGYFENLFCYSEKFNRKPAPDLYEYAISQLNLERSKLHTFEDSISGLVSAIECKIPVTCINSDSHVAKYCADHAIDHYDSASDILPILSG